MNFSEAEIHPEISIVVNCFNGEKYLSECLVSIKKQTFKNFEVIFVDNCSDDKSYEIFRDFSKDKRFQYFKTEKKISLALARNYALKQCKGKFIAFLDSDDFWIEEKLEVQMKDFNEPSVGFSASNYFLLNERKNSIHEIKIDAFLDYKKKHQVDSLLEKYNIHISTLIVKTEAIKKMEYFFDKKFNIIEDFDFVLRLSLITDLKINKNYLAGYRWHEQNLGYTTNFKVGEEFYIWINQLKIKKLFSNYKNYKIFLNRSMWLYSLYLLINNKRRDLFPLISYLSLFKKVKLLILMFLPSSIIQKYLNRKI
jgi:glycosyltransferase involved in cell wall biosynthesis